MEMPAHCQLRGDRRTWPWIEENSRQNSHHGLAALARFIRCRARSSTRERASRATRIQRGAAVGLFATKRRAGHPDGPGAGRELSEAVRQALPDRFEAVGEALASGSGSVVACDVAGRSLAQDGASLEEALPGLRATHRSCTGTEPAFADLQAIAVAWSEATLAYLHRLSCEDPLTGLASLAHVRSRLSELYRCYDYADGTVPHTHALVVLELPRGPAGRPRRPRPLLPVAAPGPARRDRAHRLPRRRDHRPARATIGCSCSPSATTGWDGVRRCCARCCCPRRTPPGSGSRGCPPPTTPRRSCSTSWPAADLPARCGAAH